MLAVNPSRSDFHDSGACLRIVSGQANLREYTLLPGASPIRIRLGSSPLCSWRVLGERVAGEHFDLVWDGSSLTLEPLPTALPVSLDGEPVKRRCDVPADCVISFGTAELQVTVAATDPRMEQRAASSRAEQTTGSRRRQTDDSQSREDISSAFPARSSRTSTRRSFSVSREVAESAGKRGRTTKTVELDLGSARASLGLDVQPEKPRLGRSAAPDPGPESAQAQPTAVEARASREPTAAKARSRLARHAIATFALVVLCAATWIVRTHELVPRAALALGPLQDEARVLARTWLAELDAQRRPALPTAPERALPAPSTAATPAMSVTPAGGVVVAAHRPAARDAAALLFAGRLEDARRAYAELGTRASEPVFKLIVQVLTRTIAERCRSLSPAERGPECTKR